MDLDWRTPTRAPERGYEVFEAELDAALEYGGLWIAVWHPFVSGRPSGLRGLEGLIERARERGAWFAPLRRSPPTSTGCDAAGGGARAWTGSRTTAPRSATHTADRGFRGFGFHDAQRDGRPPFDRSSGAAVQANPTAPPRGGALFARKGSSDARRHRGREPGLRARAARLRPHPRGRAHDDAPRPRLLLGGRERVPVLLHRGRDRLRPRAHRLAGDDRRAPRQRPVRVHRLGVDRRRPRRPADDDAHPRGVRRSTATAPTACSRG